jgi:hypothetical protein
MPDDRMNDVWMRKIEVQQAEVLTLLRKLGEKVDARIEADDEWRQKTDRILYGDGNGYRGHNVRLDRLEQAQERSKWIVRSVLVPVVLLALKALQEILTGVVG